MNGLYSGTGDRRATPSCSGLFWVALQGRTNGAAGRDRWSCPCADQTHGCIKREVGRQAWASGQQVVRFPGTAWPVYCLCVLTLARASSTCPIVGFQAQRVSFARSRISFPAFPVQPSSIERHKATELRASVRAVSFVSVSSSLWCSPLGPAALRGGEWGPWNDGRKWEERHLPCWEKNSGIAASLSLL